MTAKDSLERQAQAISIAVTSSVRDAEEPPKSTIARWMAEDAESVTALVAAKRSAIMADMLEAIHISVRAVQRGLEAAVTSDTQPSPSQTQSLATAGAILVAKLAVLSSSSAGSTRFGQANQDSAPSQSSALLEAYYETHGR